MEHNGGANTYFIATEHNAAEIARLLYQGRLLVKTIGELFPPGLDPSRWDRILDVACGPGGWALDVATRYPHLVVEGFDLSPEMIAHAHLQAWAEGLSNVHFQVMNALLPLDFPDESFDFVNANLIQSFMPPSAWPAVLEEFVRVTRPGGILRLMEFEVGVSSSAAADELYRLFAEVIQQAGRSFSSNGQHIGITPILRRLLRAAGCESIEHTAYAVDCSYGAEWHEGFSEDLIMLCRLAAPFVVRVGGPEAGQRLTTRMQEAIQELHQEAFCGVLYFLSVWGRTPGEEQAREGHESST